MQEKKIFLKNNSFILNNKPFFFYGGEIHYFRIPFNKWRMHLRRAREANLNSVSTYIPWRWHEYTQGKFDFTGSTIRERNLLLFLKMAREEGLYLFLRAGPICHAELLDDGLPGWLFDDYPQICLKKADGSFAEKPLVSFYHPTYRNFVRKWYEKIMPIIASHQISNGGNVILLQLDNEISMPNWLSKQPDHSHKTKSLYRDFLKKKYGCIENLNKAYHSHFKDFSKIDLPVFSLYDKQPGLVYWDWASFWREFYAGYYEFLAKTARSLGIEVPLVANIAQFADFDVYGRGIFSPMTSSMFKDFPRKIKDLVIGGAYQMRRLDYENFHDIAVTTEIVKMISGKNSPSMCVELQSGIMFDKPLIYPSDVELNIFTSCAHGLNGLNCYMFASGKNFPDMGWLGTNHSWQAPVALDGRKRPHYESVKKWGRIFKIFNKELAFSKKEADITVGFYMPYYMTEYLKGDFVGKIEFQRNKLFFDGICRLLELCGYNFDMVDIQIARLKDKKNLFVFCLDFMDRDTQKKLADFVKQGGKLIIGPELPLRDLSGRKFTYLENELKLYPKETRNLFIQRKGELLHVEKPIRIFDSVKATAVLETQNGEKAAVFKKIGEGKVVAFGFGLTHTFGYHIDLMQVFLDKIGLRPGIKNSVREIPAVIRKGEESSFLFVANYHQLDKDLSLKLTLADKEKPIRIPSAGSFKLPGRTCRLLPLNYQFSDRLRIIKATCQILNVIRAKNKIGLKLEVSPNAKEEIILEIKRPKYIKIDGRKVTLNLKKQTQIIKFKSQTTLAYIEVTFKP